MAASAADPQSLAVENPAAGVRRLQQTGADSQRQQQGELKSSTAAQNLSSTVTGPLEVRETSSLPPSFLPFFLPPDQMEEQRPGFQEHHNQTEQCLPKGPNCSSNLSWKINQPENKHLESVGGRPPDPSSGGGKRDTSVASPEPHTDQPRSPGPSTRTRTSPGPQSRLGTVQTTSLSNS